MQQGQKNQLVQGDRIGPDRLRDAEVDGLQRREFKIGERRAVAKARQRGFDLAKRQRLDRLYRKCVDRHVPKRRVLWIEVECKIKERHALRDVSVPDQSFACES